MASGLRRSPCRPVQRPFLIGLASQLGCKQGLSTCHLIWKTGQGRCILSLGTEFALCWDKGDASLSANASSRRDCQEGKLVLTVSRPALTSLTLTLEVTGPRAAHQQRASLPPPPWPAFGAVGAKGTRECQPRDTPGVEGQAFWSLTGGILDLWDVQRPLKTGPSAHPGIYSEGARTSQRPHALDFCREHCILILSSQKQEQGIL